MIWRIIHIMQKLLAFVFSLLCSLCKCKKRKVKEKEEGMMPTEIVIGDARPSQHVEQMHMNPPVPVASVPAYDEVDAAAMQEWNSWGNEGQSEQGEEQPNEPDPENMNFFENMEPTVKVKKVFLKKKKREKQSIGNLLAVRPDNDIQLSNELGTWSDEADEDDGAAGWEEEDIDINTDQIAAEAKALKIQERKKKAEELRRLKQMKKQKDATYQQHKLGMKVS